MSLYLAYGSNLNLHQMKHRCPTAKVVGTTYLDNYELLFRGGYRGAVATVEKKNGSRVPVLIWEIKPSDERSLDIYEGYPHLYRKEYVDVAINGKTEKVMVYIMNAGKKLNPPSSYYYNTIAEGYNDCGFDSKFLNDGVARSKTED